MRPHTHTHTHTHTHLEDALVAEAEVHVAKEEDHVRAGGHLDRVDGGRACLVRGDRHPRVAVLLLGVVQVAHDALVVLDPLLELLEVRVQVRSDEAHPGFADPKAEADPALVAREPAEPKYR